VARFHSLLSLGKHTCREQARRLDDALIRLLDAPDTEAVHDVRVACRRLETALKITAPLYQNLEPLRKKVKHLLKTLSDVRDIEVLAERARNLPQNGDGKAASQAQKGSQHLAELLDAKVELGRIAGTAELSRMAAMQLPHEIEKALHALGLHRGKLRRFPKLRLHQFAGEALRDNLAAVQALDIRRSSSGEELHALRVEFKRLRYAAEFFEPALPGRAIHQLIKVSQRYQQILGELHDADVALEAFHEWQALHVRKHDDDKKQTTPAQRRYRQIQAGVLKLMEQARNEQIKVRLQFFKLWTVRHQRELAGMIGHISREKITRE